MLLLNEAGNLPFLVAQHFRIASVQIVRRDTQNLKALCGILITQIDQPRGLDLAGSAPGGPEVDQKRLAFVIGE